jgi:hypothetical protein
MFRKEQINSDDVRVVEEYLTQILTNKYSLLRNDVRDKMVENEICRRMENLEEKIVMEDKLLFMICFLDEWPIVSYYPLSEKMSIGSYKFPVKPDATYLVSTHPTFYGSLQIKHHEIDNGIVLSISTHEQYYNPNEIEFMLVKTGSTFNIYNLSPHDLLLKYLDMTENIGVAGTDGHNPPPKFLKTVF